MARYNKQIVCKIIELAETGKYSTLEICKIVGIGRKTYYRWREIHPQFSEALEEVREQRYELLKMEAEQILKQKLKGYTQEVKRTIYVPSTDNPTELVIKQHVITEKVCEPDTKLLLELINNGKLKRKECQDTNKVESLAINVNGDKAKEDLTKLNR